MKTGFVIGNGKSRKGISLAALAAHGETYGCNALYREFTPNVLVATDRPIATEIQRIGYPHKHTFYTRHPVKNSPAKTVPAQYFGFSSGPIAAAIAAKNCDRIFLIGFDFGSRPGEKFNNIYAGTSFYKKEHDRPTPGDNWIKQIQKIVKDNPGVKFYRVAGPESNDLTFDLLDNYQTAKYDIRIEMIWLQ
jgi:hypothetical protein